MHVVVGVGLRSFGLEKKMMIKKKKRPPLRFEDDDGVCVCMYVFAFAIFFFPLNCESLKKFYYYSCICVKLEESRRVISHGFHHIFQLDLYQKIC